MSAGQKYLPKAKRPVSRHTTVPEIRAEHCMRCGGRLDPAKYHDCGEQPALPLPNGQA